MLTSGAGLDHRPELPLLLDLRQDPVVEAGLLGRRRTEAALGNLGARDIHATKQRGQTLKNDVRVLPTNLDTDEKFAYTRHNNNNNNSVNALV